MNKLFLIGGNGLNKYSVADQLWKVINTFSDIKFDFSMLEIHSEKDLEGFVHGFKNDSNIKSRKS